MAPEILARKNHSFSVDYYALGIIIHECILGFRPYNGKTRKDFREQVFAKQARIKRENVPEKIWSTEAINFCNSLIQRKRNKRLGEQSISELKNHPWLKKFNWQQLENKEMNSPYKINLREDHFDKNHVLKEDPDFNSEDLKKLKQKDIQMQFQGYEYNEQLNHSKSLTMQEIQSTCISTKQLI